MPRNILKALEFYLIFGAGTSKSSVRQSNLEEKRAVQPEDADFVCDKAVAADVVLTKSWLDALHLTCLNHI